MTPERHITCDYHLDCQKENTETRTNQENQGKSLEELWRRFNDTEREVQKREADIDHLQKDFDDLKDKIETNMAEDSGYQTMVRNTNKAVEKLHNRLDECPEKKETASKQEVEDIKTWVRYGWLATIAAVIMLVANLVLVLIPLIWDKKPPVP